MGRSATGSISVARGCCSLLRLNKLAKEKEVMIEQPGATLPLVTIFGPPGSALGYAIRDFLYRSDVPFEWVQLATDAQARSDAGVEHLADSRLPVCVFADGTRLECPTFRQITEQLGWFRNPTRS